jgi:hypothetical protein
MRLPALPVNRREHEWDINYYCHRAAFTYFVGWALGFIILGGLENS